MAAITCSLLADDRKEGPRAGAGHHRRQQLIFASAALGPTGQNAGGLIINAAQYIGVRFQVDRETQITGVGGHIGAENDLSANIFYATIVRLPDAAALPAGAPFDDDEIVASVLCAPTSNFSLDYVFPLKAKLSPGSYTLVFGGGGTNAYMVENNPASPDASFIGWDLNTGWRNEPTLTNIRFTLYGTIKP